MTTSKYFRPHTYGRFQRTAEDLVVNSIKQYGTDIKYLPRTLVNQDFLLGEDPLSKFELAVNIEVYVKNVQSFGGDGDLLAKLGQLEIRDTITFTMARRRWDQVSTEKLIMENGSNYQLESANTHAWGNSQCLRLEASSANGYQITSPRPMEGDVIFFPFNNKLYEIKFVEHEAIFYQHGKLYTYDLQCELFDRDSRLQTGNTAIDGIEDLFSQDILKNRYLAEDGTYVLREDGGYLIREYRLEDTVPSANNEYIGSLANEYVDFSETNPFTEWE